jgi:putative ABC transport system permease protein
MARASYESIVAWMDGALNPDLFVLPSQSLDITTTRFPATVGQEIAAISGVRRVQMVRNGRVAFRQGSAMVVAIEVASLAETDTRPPVAGNAAEMYRTCAAGRGVMVSDNFARLQNLRLGDTIEIPAPYGIVQLPVTGVVLDYSDQQGSIILDRKLFIKYWHDDSVNAVRVYVADGTSAFDVRHRILETSAGRRQTFVLTNAELKTYIRKVAGQWFGLTSVQITAAVLVAVLGIVNTLTVSITDRRRELGVLRAVGASHPQIRRTIWLEAVGIAVLGLILGCALGAINLYYVLQIVDRDIAGMRLDYRLPGGIMLGLVPIIVAAGLASALWPAESALRGSLVEALEYE